MLLHPRLSIVLLFALFALGMAAAPARSTVPLYPGGSPNPETYSFSAAADGHVAAYFAGSSAGYTETLGLLVNGVESPRTGLDNQRTARGAMLDFGPVNAGDSLVFFINVATTGERFHSDPALNMDGLNHVFAAPFTGDPLLPSGLYLGFEDIRGGGDFDYDDLQFIVTNVRAGNAPGDTAAIPEPATWALLLAGFGLVGLAARRRRLAQCHPEQRLS